MRNRETTNGAPEMALVSDAIAEVNDAYARGKSEGIADARREIQRELEAKLKIDTINGDWRQIANYIETLGQPEGDAKQ